jgi:putative ABC transport system permease protein
MLLRALGATRAQLVKIQLVEYSVLGILAALTGGALAVAAEWFLAHFVFATALVIPSWALVGSVAGVATVTVVTGWLANRDVFGRSPLDVLRQEGS